MNKFNEKTQDFLDLFRVKEETQETTPRNDLEEYKRKVQREKRRRYIMVIAIVLITVVAVFAAKNIIEKRTYDSYKVLEMSEQLDSSVLNYKELGNYVLRYSGDGVSLINISDRVVWNDSIQMTAPVAVSFDEVAAIYETKGTEVHVYGIDGKMGTIKTDYPILKASVSSLGGVAVILENDENTLINYYSADGSLIASSSTNMRNPGYPVDLSISKDGLSLVVSYFVADGSDISSYLAFYNFGEAGKNKEDNLLDGVRFDGILVPKVQYLDNKTLVVYREDGFTLYKSTSLLEEVKKVTFEKEIISSFSDGDLFGFVFSGSGDHAFEMKVYNSSGGVQLESDFDLVYDKIKISDNQIILHNSNQFAIISASGTVRFSGNFEEGNILDIVKRGMNRYSVACSKGIANIELD